MKCINIRKIFIISIIILAGLLLYSQEIRITQNGSIIPVEGVFNFNNIPAQNRMQNVEFKIKNLTNNTIDITSITIADSALFSVTPALINGLASNSEATIFIKYISNASDDKLKRSNVTVNYIASSVNKNHQFKVMCTSMASGIVEFKKAGTYYWQSPVNGWFDLVLIGGGGGGAGAFAFGYEQSYLGSGGGAGEVIVTNNNIVNNSTNNVYKIIIGSGGNGGVEIGNYPYNGCGEYLPSATPNANSSGSDGGNSNIILNTATLYNARGGGGGKGLFYLYEEEYDDDGYTYYYYYADYVNISAGTNYANGPQYSEDGYYMNGNQSCYAGDGGDNSYFVGGFGRGEECGGNNATNAALKNATGNGCGGGGGGQDRYNDYNEVGGPGGKGFDGYCRITWRGFIIP